MKVFLILVSDIIAQVNHWMINSLGQGFPGGGLGEMLGGGFDPSVLQGMSEEDQRAVLAAMQEGNEGICFSLLVDPYTLL